MTKIGNIAFNVTKNSLNLLLYRRTSSKFVSTVLSILLQRIISMSKLADIVGTLEVRLEQLLNQHQKLKEELVLMEQERQQWLEKEKEYEEEILHLQNETEVLKHANSILGSDQYNRETKRKINALIREIDECIVHLSE